MERFDSVSVRPGYAVDEAQNALLRSVFGWMTAGLLLTAAVSFFVLSPQIAPLVLRPGLLLVLMLVEIGLVVWLSVRVMKMSATKATGVFLAYSAINGITLAPLAFVYTGESIASVFMITAALFGVMAFYGFVTKKDLSSWGTFLWMGLIGIIIASLVNMFLGSSGLGFGISVAVVIVFTGLTAWDVQKIKNMGAQFHADSGTAAFRRVAIMGALSLYLDFINLFIALLRLFGSRD